MSLAVEYRERGLPTLAALLERIEAGRGAGNLSTTLPQYPAGKDVRICGKHRKIVLPWHTPGCGCDGRLAVIYNWDLLDGRG